MSYIGFSKTSPEEVIRAHDKYGILKTETAYEILSALLDGHDHKENCTCFSHYGTLKQWDALMHDNEVDLQIMSLLGK